MSFWDQLCAACSKGVTSSKMGHIWNGRPHVMHAVMHQTNGGRAWCASSTS